MIMLIMLIKKTILIHNFNFDRKTLVYFKKLNQKNQILSSFQKSRPN